MIELADVHKSFGANHVIRGISARIAIGEVVCIIGPSGSGKSTILRCINVIPMRPVLNGWIAMTRRGASSASFAEDRIPINNCSSSAISHLSFVRTIAWVCL